MDQGDRALLAGAPEVGCAAAGTGWNGLWQNAVGYAMGRDEAVVTHVSGCRRWGAAILAELTR
ncbi:MAG: hypothetical protein ABW137_11715 [Mycobacterium sp.]